MKANTIYCGDCLEVLRDFPDESVDLIYLDPAFFTSKSYEVIFDDEYKIRSFQDAYWYSEDVTKRTYTLFDGGVEDK